MLLRMTSVITNDSSISAIEVAEIEQPLVITDYPQSMCLKIRALLCTLKEKQFQEVIVSDDVNDLLDQMMTYTHKPSPKWIE